MKDGLKIRSLTKNNNKFEKLIFKKIIKINL